MFVLAAVSALFVGYGSLLFALGQWSRHWPALPGVIESCQFRTGPGVGGARAHWVEAHYTWHAGIARHGAWIGFACPGTASNPKLTPSAAKALQAELVRGARVDVFVCPRWPDIAVLRSGPNLAALGYAGLGACFGWWAFSTT
jgi:hypothetical protein